MNVVVSRVLRRGGLFFLQRVGRANEFCQNTVERSGELAHRRLEATEQLRQQHFTTWNISKLLDLRSVEQ